MTNENGSDNLGSPAIEPTAPTGSPAETPTTPTTPVVEPTAEPVAKPVEPTPTPVEPTPEPVKPIINEDLEASKAEAAKLKLDAEKLSIANKAKDDEIAALKKTMAEADNVEPVEPILAPEATDADVLLKVETLTEDQKADMLIYGNTYVDEHGERLDPSEIVVDEGGNVKYQRNESGW